MFRDPRVHTLKWAARHPLGMGLVVGAIFYLMEVIATGDLLGTLPFAAVIGAIFWVTSLGERRRRNKHHLPR